ncbi:MAG: hypothetical protein GX998_11480 [Firmicutes bacterium]|nr:hypothetical protein [Bacillota bacterium]
MNNAVSGAFAAHLHEALDTITQERLDQQMGTIKAKTGLARDTSLAEQRATSLAKQQEQLRQAALDLEALLLNQMISAMQRTIPRGEGMLRTSQAEKLFRGMLDEQWAKVMAESGDIGLASSLYDQLNQSLLEKGKADSTT